VYFEARTTQPIGKANMQISRYLDIQISGHRDIQISGIRYQISEKIPGSPTNWFFQTVKSKFRRIARFEAMTS